MNKFNETRVIAIARNLGKENMRKLAGALLDGGIALLEVTFNQNDSSSWADTCASIALVADAFGDSLAIGAGTVITEDQLRMARDSGAEYMVAPNTNAKLISLAKKLGMAAFPGAMTPTECVIAHEAGADAVKLFPASVLGAGYVKAIRAPLSHIKFIAVGGVNTENARGFIEAGCVGVGVGGNLASRALIEAGKTENITALAREYIKAVG